MKWNTLLAAALIAATLTACSMEENNQAVPVNKVEDEPVNPGLNNDAGEGAAEAGNPFPADAYEGKIAQFYYGLNDYTEGLIEELGEPGEIDYFTGGLYFSYPDVVYFTDAELAENDEIIHGTIKRIGVRQGSMLFGVTVGQTFDEIAEALGTDYTMNSPEDNMNNEYYDSVWSMQYKVGDYELVFTAEQEEGPTEAAYFEVAL